MPLDPYSACLCGSGKKFKWCCQPVHADIERAYAQEAQGQHEAALQLIEQVVQANPGNPEAWGRRADLLFRNQRLDEAEQSLNKAFAINPNYPFGLYLQGMLRYLEHELPGALLLFRKAADAYDPSARDILGAIEAQIAEIELQLGRPVAAHAALRMALHLFPQDQKLKTSYDSIFGAESDLPAVARKDYKFRPLEASAEPSERDHYARALGSATTGKLRDVLETFQAIVQRSAESAAAWFNLGLTLAWLGQNREGIEALDQSMARERDDSLATETGALSSVLRQGYQMEEYADYLEYSVDFRLRDGDPRVLLDQWQAANRLVSAQVSPDQTYFTALVLEKPTALTPELAATKPPHIGAHLLLTASTLRIWHTELDALTAIRQEIEQALGPTIVDVHTSRTPAPLQSILNEALVFPRGQSPESAIPVVEQHFARYVEETWIHKPLRSLDNVPPIDAAGHPVLRKKLLGVVLFLEDAAPLEKYDFNRLRRKLGLLQDHPTQLGDRARDYTAMSPAELASLAVAEMSGTELEGAFRSAIQLDARELAGRFAAELVKQPPRPDRPDRYPWYSHLIQQATAEDRLVDAIDLVNSGEKADCEENEGRRRNDYELRRAQLLARQGEIEQAEATFSRLIERAPDDTRFRGAAAEAMLGAKQSERARAFAQGGLARARQQNARDSEAYFLELVDAANRLAPR
jgi:tetratricopeptide (TPR) repeat protein